MNGLGVSEPMIQTRGNNQIIVELPGVEDPQEAIEVLQQTALLEIIDPQGQSYRQGTTVNTTLDPAEARRLAGGRTAAVVEGSPVAARLPRRKPSPVAPRNPPERSTNDHQRQPTSTDAYVTTGNTGEVVVAFEL